MYKSTHSRLAKSTFPVAAVVFCLGSTLGGPAWASPDGTQASAGQPDAQSSQAAVWTPKEVTFTYMGFTAYYSCDGLRDTITRMLLQLGARKDDLKVIEEPCSGDPDRPNPFPGVRIKMSVLTPAPAASSSDKGAVGAQWKTVKLPYRENPINAAGECELLEQFRKTILPAFTTRNVNLHATCVPHQLEPLGTSLQADVLVPVAANIQAAAPHTH